MILAKKNGTQKQPGRGFVARLGSWIAAAIMIFAVLWVGLFFWFVPSLPNTNELWTARPSPGVTYLSVRGDVIAQRGAFRGAMVPLADMPPHMTQAVIATEDRRFYSHFGMDVIGFARALYNNIRAGRVVQGGSTLTQQLAKNLYLTPQRTLKRKIQELMLAIWLEARLSKNEILTLYLNKVYLGAGTYGVEAASQRYFGKSVRQVTLPEAALLAGLLKAPTRYAPTNDLKLSRARAAQVLANMVDAEYLTSAQAKTAQNRPARLAHNKNTRNSQYFLDWIEEHLSEMLGPTGEDIVVVTTLDLHTQRAAERAVESVLLRDGKERAVGQAALVAVNMNGGVRAMVGGRNYNASQFNRSTQAQRQPASAFKPFVYLTGLEAGLSPDDKWRDAAVTVEKWQPRNYTGTYLGDITLETALARSINTVAVKVSEHVGRDNVVETAQRLGIRSTIASHPSLALGTSEVNLLELSGAYVPFANGGFGVAPYGIIEVRTRSGNLLYRNEGRPKGRVIDARQVAQMNRMLKASVQSGAGRAARLNGRQAAGKTGTSQNFRDGWFVGYTADFVAGVWVGNDDNTPMRRVSGGQLPAAIWRQFMTDATKDLPARPIADQIAGTGYDDVRRAVNKGTGVLQNLVDGIAGLFSTSSGNSKGSPPSKPYEIKEDELESYD